MDPRQQPPPPPPQHPFTNRNAPSPLYSRSPFPPANAPPPGSSKPPYPPSSHGPSTAPAYAEHQRRTSDNPYYSSQPRQYPPEQAPPPPSNHTRHTSASAVHTAPSLSRPMPPPLSPPQQPGGHAMAPYGLPPPRPPPVSAGPPGAFSSGRELPALGSLARTGGAGSSMSISSMLGGPPPRREIRESRAPTAPTQYASPRMHSATANYAGFRHPRTPEPQRPYEQDQRGATTASPQGLYSTPELQRYGTPQGYGQGPPPHPATDPAREQARMSVIPPHPNNQRPPPHPAADQARDQVRMSTIPPHPNSQRPPPPQAADPAREQAWSSAAPPHPNSMQRMGLAGLPPPRVADPSRPPPPPESIPVTYGRRDEETSSAEYNPERPIQLTKYEDPRYMERERQERELDMRERERRERAYSGNADNRPYLHPATDYPNRPQQPHSYPRGPDPHEAAWAKQPVDHRPYDPAAQHPRHAEYPHGGPTAYGAHPPAYSQPPHDRYPPASHAAHHPAAAPSGPPAAHAYEPHDRQRMGLPHPQHPDARHLEEGPPLPSVAYSGRPTLFESRMHDDLPPQAGQPRSLLLIQEMNRKGRISPLPQAVQGAQPQLSGPGGEPGIKSEFGRMFSGIGSGVGMGLSSPVAVGAQLPYATAGLMRREDSDGTPQDPAADPTKSVHRQKRRKVKEEDGRIDEDAGGRATPLGRKRPKTHGHHHHHHHHHHHRHAENASSPSHAGITPFKHGKGATPMASPTGLVRDLSGQGLHTARGPRTNGHPAPNPVVPPMVKPKLTVNSKAVLDSVADRPRNHLGDVVYDLKLKPARRQQDSRTGRTSRYFYRSNPVPLPWDRIEEKENCTLTVKVPKEFLVPATREEITNRCAVWGTDVYTDDSDVIAACIHAGWIRGEWPEDVDTSLLDLDVGIGAEPDKVKRLKKDAAAAQAVSPEVLTAPPKTGPVLVPPEKDLHVTLLVLPTLVHYGSTTRFGLRSREWPGPREEGSGRPGRGQKHDGLSFMILGIRWVVNGAGASSRLRGRARRERMHRAMREVRLSRSAELNTMHLGAAAAARKGPDGGPSAGKRPAGDAGEDDKENRPVGSSPAPKEPDETEELEVPEVPQQPEEREVPEEAEQPAKPKELEQTDDPADPKEPEAPKESEERPDEAEQPATAETAEEVEHQARAADEGGSGSNPQPDESETVGVGMDSMGTPAAGTKDE